MYMICPNPPPNLLILPANEKKTSRFPIFRAVPQYPVSNWEISTPSDSRQFPLTDLGQVRTMSKYLTDDDVAKILGITKKTLWNRFAEGSDMPPFIRRENSRKRIYRLSAVESWVERNRPFRGRGYSNVWDEI